MPPNSPDVCTRCGALGATVMVPQKGGDRYVHVDQKACEDAIQARANAARTRLNAYGNPTYEDRFWEP